MLKAEIKDKDTNNKIGLKVFEDHFLKCENCQNLLVEVLVVYKSELKQKFVTKCPICGDKTFILSTVGETILQTTQDFELINVDSEWINDNTMIHKLEIQCVKKI